MTYPTMTVENANALVAKLLALPSDARVDAQFDEGDHVEMVDGADVDLAAAVAASSAARAEWVAFCALSKGEPSSTERQRLEARMASVVHEALAALPRRALGDMGFWRYLALFPFRWYLDAREPEMQAQDYGGSSVIVGDATRRKNADPKYQLILRTFLWGKAAYDPSAADPYHRATLVGSVGGAEIDVWHSHVVRVQLGHLGRMTHHFIDSICELPRACERDSARDVEKLVTRMKHNVLLDLYDEDGKDLVDSLKAKVLNLPPP